MKRRFKFLFFGIDAVSMDDEVSGESGKYKERLCLLQGK